MVQGWVSFERGYIIYNNANGGDDPANNQWEALRQVEAYAGTYYFNMMKKENVLNETIAQGGALLELMAKAERTKEESWLRSLYGNVSFPPDEIGYIKIINELYNGEENFSKIVTKLLQNLQRNLSTDGPTLRAPSLIANYVDRFSSSLREYIIRTVTQEGQQGILDMLSGKSVWWDKAFKFASENGFEKIVNASHSENSKYFGEGEDYYEVLEAMRQMMEENDSFSKYLQSYFHLDKVKNNLIQTLSEGKGKKVLKYRKKNKGKLLSDQKMADLLTIDTVKKNIASSESEERQLSGGVYEYVRISLLQMLTRGLGKQALGESLGNVNATDTTLLQADARIKITDVYQQLMAATTGNSQAEIALELKNFYQHWRSQDRKKFYVINTSNKLYTLSKDHPFKKTAKLYDLDKVLKHNFTSTKGGAQRTLPGYGILTNSQSVHNLTTLVYNTMKGAFLDEHRKEVIDSFRQVLATGAANLLFSDYYNVGDEATEGVNAIHLFDIDETYIPLSVILQGMANAYLKTGSENYTRYISLAQFSTNLKDENKRTSILYPRAVSYEDKDYKKERYDGLEISEAWNKQREIARQQVTFDIRFANNFQNIIKDIAQQYGIIKMGKGGKFNFI